MEPISSKSIKGFLNLGNFETLKPRNQEPPYPSTYRLPPLHPTTLLGDMSELPIWDSRDPLVDWDFLISAAECQETRACGHDDGQTSGANLKGSSAPKELLWGNECFVLSRDLIIHVHGPNLAKPNAGCTIRSPGWILSSPEIRAQK